MGHDSGPPGDDAVELVHMVEAGLGPLQAITAATGGSAKALGLEDCGTIQPGSQADLLVVERNPLDDVGILRDRARIYVVIKDGAPVAGRALDGRGLQPAE
jgi:imidazolonepropionase-like amidohydrolase